MRLTNAFFANHAEVVDDMLNVTGGCWTSTTVADGSTAFATRCVIFCEVSRQDRGKEFGLHIDAAGPTGSAVDAGAIVVLHRAEPHRVHGHAPDRAADRARRVGCMSTPSASKDHEEQIVLPLHIHVVAGSAFPSR